MDVNIRFAENVLKWKNSQINLPKDKNIFLLSSLKTVGFPQKFLNWAKKTLSQTENNLVPFPVEDSSEFLHGIVVWMKEGEIKELQMDYKNAENSKESHKIRNFFFLEKNSSLNWIEHFSNSSFQTENYIFVEDGAVFNQLTINQSHSSSKIYCDLQKNSSFFSLDINLSSWSKCVQVYGRKPCNTSVIRGLNLLKQKDHSSWFVLNQHDGVSGYSRQWYRSILDGRSKNSIHSKVSIQAQEADSHQMLQDLILSPYAKTKNKPELEVSKDQVKATHGATTGTLNPMEIFYMNTRGISKEKALEFLVTGWAIAVLSESDNDSFNEFLKKITPSLRPFLKNHMKQLQITQPE